MSRVLDSCVVVGLQSNSRGRTTSWSAVWRSGAPQAKLQRIPVPTRDARGREFGLSHVGCMSSDNCLSVGDGYRDGAPDGRAVAFTLSQGEWRAVPRSVAPRLGGVGCGPGRCLLVGDVAGQTLTMRAVMPGQRGWRSVIHVVPDSQVSAISCGGRSSCDVSLYSRTTSRLVSVLWPSRIEQRDLPLTGPTSFSCTSNGRCLLISRRLVVSGSVAGVMAVPLTGNNVGQAVHVVLPGVAGTSAAVGSEACAGGLCLLSLGSGGIEQYRLPGGSG
jgi:hypothetical protein